MARLAGIRVLDLSRILGGPYCGQVLGDHGADVLKVEPPQGDDTRTWGPPFKDGVASYYHGLNRNKRGIAPRPGIRRRPRGAAGAAGRGRRAGRELQDRHDGAAGASATSSLSQRFPRLVHCRVSGFGADGPLGGLPGYDAAVQAMAGIMSVNGEVGRRAAARRPAGGGHGDRPERQRIGVLLALQERARSGRGQFVEAALYDSGLSLLHPHAANWFLDGREPRRTGNAHPNIYPYDAFPTGTAPIFLAVGNDRQFRLLCEHLDVPALAQ